jgi:hypothetical protein
MVVHIIEKTGWRRPLYFTTFVDPSKMLGLDAYLSIEGLVLKIAREKSPTGSYTVNAAALDKNLFTVYRYRGIADAEVYKSEETMKMLQNYFIACIELCDTYAGMGEREGALRAARRAYEFALGEPERLDLLRQVLREKGLENEAGDMLKAQ